MGIYIYNIIKYQVVGKQVQCLRIELCHCDHIGLSVAHEATDW